MSPSPQSAPGSARTLAIALAVVTLPFMAHWLDFEAARRALGMCVGAAAAWTAWRWLPGSDRQRGPKAPAGSGWLLALVLWAGVRSLGVTNPGEAVLRAGWLGTLWLVYRFGATQPTQRVGQAVLATVALVASYGLLQAMGVEWPEGYARTEPVSTLGNANVASEFVALAALALAATWVLSRRPNTVGPAACDRQPTGLTVALALGLSVAYLAVNGSRSGLLAISVGAVVILVDALRAPAQRGRSVQAAAAGAAILIALGAWIASPASARDEKFAREASELANPAADSAATADAADATTTPFSRPSTIAVRGHIWRAGLEMVGDAPWFGHGSGQFRYQYPLYRSPAEIDLSSHNRSFRTFVGNPHQDHLQIAIEGGIPAILLWVGFWWTVFRAALRRGPGSWLSAVPLLGFVLLATVRAPLGNAPAALLAFAWAGSVTARRATDSVDTVVAPRPGPRPSIRHGARLAAVALAVVGLLVLSAQCSFSLSFDDRGRSVDADLVRAARSLHPTESRFRRKVASLTWQNAPDARAALDAARPDIDALLALDPHNTSALFFVAYLAHHAGDDALADASLARLLAIDPLDPEATQLAATRLALRGEAPRAIATLYSRPHARLRAVLAETLADLGAALADRDPRGAQLLRSEASFVRALDSLLVDPRSTAVFDASATLPQSWFDDHRRRALVARQFLARGDATTAAAVAPDGPADLSGAARRLLAPILTPLRSLPAWQRALGED